MPAPAAVITAFAALGDVGAPFTPPPAALLSDSELLESQRLVAQIRRRADAAAAALAAEIAHRSRRELGYEGLATRLGARTPEALVARVSGTSARDAGALVRVGAMSADPWLGEVSSAVARGQLSVDAADVIRSGLGSPDEAVSAPALRSAVDDLLADAPTLSVEQLAARARELRAELDEAGVSDREARLREARYLRVIPQSDGMTRISGLLDPESAAVVVAAYDSATSPRRGGPRFVDADAVATADELSHDARSTDQLAVDAFVELLRLGGGVDPNAIRTHHRPAVRIAVAERDLRLGTGAGWIEGQTSAISIASVERAACDAGVLPIVLDSDGQVVNIGRAQRLFTSRQRIGLAVRDGGCRFPGCDRPPSWCEAHHIDEWLRDRGRTDIADGILLCRHHHLLVHNNGWRVVREAAEYSVVPPRSIDAAQRPIPAPSRSAVRRRVLAGA